MNRFDHPFTVDGKDYTVGFLEKDDEGFLFIDIQYTPVKGKHRENVPFKEQQPIALLAKDWYEQGHGLVTQFHYDNMAGGLSPRTPVTAQIWRPLRDDRTGAMLQPGNAKPGQTEMISHGLWSGNIDRNTPDIWTAPGDGLQSWERDPALNSSGNPNQDRIAELMREVEELRKRMNS